MASQEACSRLGTELKVREFVGDETDARAFVRSAATRRDMTPAQRGFCAAAAGYGRPGGDRRSIKPDSSVLIQPELLSDLAKRWAVGENYVTWARQLLDGGRLAADLIERAVSGDLSLRDAADQLRSRQVAAGTRQPKKPTATTVRRGQSYAEPILTGLARSAPVASGAMRRADTVPSREPEPGEVKQQQEPVAKAAPPTQVVGPSPEVLALVDAYEGAIRDASKGQPLARVAEARRLLAARVDVWRESAR